MRCCATWSPAVIRREITAGQAARILERVTPSGAVARARCELAAEFLTDIRRLDAQLRDTNKKLAAAVKASGTSLTGIFGVGPVIAGTVIGDVRQVFRFPSRDHFAACNGTAPVEVSSGGRKVYRLSLRGNRRLNHAIHMAAVTQIRHKHSQGRAYYEQETGRGQDAQGGAAGAQTPDQRRDLRGPGSRRPASRSHLLQGPGRATGEPLCLQGGRLTPRAPALRASHSRACHHPTARHHRRSRPDPAEPSLSAPGRALRGHFQETPHNHLTPTAKRTRSARRGSVSIVGRLPRRSWLYVAVKVRVAEGGWCPGLSRAWRPAAVAALIE